jgi:DNA-binding Lrp family transcriptional regulator
VSAQREPEATRQSVADFEAALAQVVEARRLFGDPDYLLQGVAKDLPAFQTLYDAQLTSIANVKRLSSTRVVKEVIQDQWLPR